MGACQVPYPKMSDESTIDNFDNPSNDSHESFDSCFPNLFTYVFSPHGRRTVSPAAEGQCVQLPDCRVIVFFHNL